MTFLQLFTIALASSPFIKANPIAQVDPASIAVRADTPPLPYRLDPLVLSQYNTNTGAVTYNTGRGKVYKAPSDPNAISTLVTFQIPSWATGLNCSAQFALNSASNIVVSGTRQLDLYRSLAPASPGGQYNGRDWNFGRYQLSGANPPGQASFIYTGKGEWLPCPEAGLVLGVELVGAGDSDRVEWIKQDGVNGPYVMIADL